MLNSIFKNGKGIFIREQSDILSASAVMMFLMLLTKAVGLLTKVVVVAQLGVEKYGIFIAANTLPEILSMLLLFGGVTSVVIPILVEVIQKNGKRTFSTLFSSIVNIGLLAFSISAIIFIIIAKDVTPLVIEKIARPVEPFTQNQIEQIVAMMRWLLLPQVILGISSFISTALNAYKRFIIPQIAPLFYNLGILFGAAFIIPLTGGSSWGLTWGALIGSILHLLVQLPLSSHLKIRYRFVIDWSNEALRKTFTIGFPRIIALVAHQIAVGIDRVIAIGFGAAALGAFDLAVRLVTIPYSLFSTSFSVASLPALSAEFAKGDLAAFKSIFVKVFNQILYLTIPITVILLVLRVPLVRLFYGIFGQEFTWENTLMVAWVVFFFSLGLIPEVLMAFLYRAFYAICDTVRPLLVGLFVVVGGAVTGILFTNYFSHIDKFSLRLITWNPSFFLSRGSGVAAVGGLALSSSLIYTIAFFALFALLLKKIGGLNRRRFWSVVIKKLLFGSLMAIFMYGLFKLWDEVLDTAKTINVFILTFSTIVSGISVYFWLSHLFKDPECEIVQKLFNAVKNVVKKALLV